MAINLNDLAGALMGAQEQPAAPRASRDQYGTIALDAQGTPTVMLDGGTDYAPCTCMVGVHHGDRVLAHVVNHKIVVFANITAPTTDDATALVAIDRADVAAEAADAAGIAAASAQADATQAKTDAATAKTAAQGAVADAADAKAAATQAQADAQSAAQDAASAAASAQSAEEDAQAASTAATSAQGSAQTAQQAAQSAQSDAADAASAAQSAHDDATSAASSASAAASSASTAQAQASAATTAANEAKADAKTAKDNAAQAVSDAKTAKQAATDATTTANGAVTALATVQGVVDQLETDVDELQVHVAMMDAYSDGHGGTVPAGLHVVPTGSGYFLVIANDGTYVYDAQSVLVTKFGESVDFSSTRPQRIGNDTAYVEYYDSDNDGVPDSIRIVGTNLNAEIANFRQTVSETYATNDSVSDIDTRLTTAESSITQQADEIALKANAADVNTKQETAALLEVKANKATLTSEINASADTVKIDANRVNITGEAVFSAINDDTSTTKINGGKIDADTLHVKAANIDGSLTIGKVSGLQDALDGKQPAGDYATTANLEVANGRITTLVEGLEQSSYFQQTEDGFTFAIDGAISTVAQAANNAQDSADSAATAAAAAAQAAEDASRVARDYLTFQNGELTIGTSESDIRSVLTNVKFAFKTDAGDIAYFGLNNDGIWQMHIATAFVDDMLRFGDYAWVKRDNGNMSIKWLGA